MIYKGIQLSNKKEQTTNAQNKMVEPHNSYGEWNKPHTPSKRKDIYV